MFLTRKEKLALVAEATQQRIDRYCKKYPVYICGEYGIDGEIPKLLRVTINDRTWTCPGVEIGEVYGLIKELLERVLDEKVMDVLEEKKVHG